MAKTVKKETLTEVEKSPLKKAKITSPKQDLGTKDFSTTKTNNTIVAQLNEATSEDQANEQKLQTQLANLQDKIAATGKKYDPRNTMQKLLGLADGQGVISGALDLINRPLGVVKNAVNFGVNNNKSGYDNFESALWGGLKGDARNLNWTDALGLEAGQMGGAATFFMDLGLDMTLDPLNFMPAGAIWEGIKKTGKGAGKLIKATAKSWLPEDLYNRLAETMLNAKDSFGRKLIPGYATSQELKDTNSFLETAQNNLKHESGGVLDSQFNTIRRQSEDIYHFLKSRKIPQGADWEHLMKMIGKGDHKSATNLFDALTEEMGIRNYEKDWDKWKKENYFGNERAAEPHKMDWYFHDEFMTQKALEFLRTKTDDGLEWFQNTMKESERGVSGLDITEARTILSRHTSEFENYLKNHYESFTQHSNAVDRVHKSLSSLYNEILGAQKTGQVSKAAFGGIINALSSIDGLAVPAETIDDVHGLMQYFANYLGMDVNDNTVKTMLRYQTSEQFEAMKKAQKEASPETARELSEAQQRLNKAKATYNGQIDKIKKSMNNLKESDELKNARGRLDALIEKSKRFTEERNKAIQSAISKVDSNYTRKSVRELYGSDAYDFYYTWSHEKTPQRAYEKELNRLFHLEKSNKDVVLNAIKELPKESLSDVSALRKWADEAAGSSKKEEYSGRFSKSEEVFLDRASKRKGRTKTETQREWNRARTGYASMRHQLVEDYAAYRASGKTGSFKYFMQNMSENAFKVRADRALADIRLEDTKLASTLELLGKDKGNAEKYFALQKWKDEQKFEGSEYKEFKKTYDDYKHWEDELRDKSKKAKEAKGDVTEEQTATHQDYKLREEIRQARKDLRYAEADNLKNYTGADAEALRKAGEELEEAQTAYDAAHLKDLNEKSSVRSKEEFWTEGEAPEGVNVENAEYSESNEPLFEFSSSSTYGLEHYNKYVETLEKNPELKGTQQAEKMQEYLLSHVGKGGFLRFNKNHELFNESMTNAQMGQAFLGEVQRKAKRNLMSNFENAVGDRMELTDLTDGFFSDWLLETGMAGEGKLTSKEIDRAFLDSDEFKTWFDKKVAFDDEMRLREEVELPAYVTTKNPNFLDPSYAASTEILQNMLYRFADEIGADANILEQYAGLRNVTNPEEGILINILKTIRSPKASGAYKASHMNKQLKGMVSEEIWKKTEMYSGAVMNNIYGFEMFSSSELIAQAVQLKVLPEQFKFSKIVTEGLMAGDIAAVSQGELLMAESRGFKRPLESGWAYIDAEEFADKVKHFKDMMPPEQWDDYEKDMELLLSEGANGGIRPKMLKVKIGLLDWIERPAKTMEVMPTISNFVHTIVKPWKAVLLATPGYHIRNIISNFANAFVAGVNPGRYTVEYAKATGDSLTIRNMFKDAAKLMPKHSKDFNHFRTDEDITRFMKEIAGKGDAKKAALFDEYMELARQGVTSQSRIRSDFWDYSRSLTKMGRKQGWTSKALGTVFNANMEYGQLSDESARWATHRIARENPKLLAQYGHKNATEFTKFVHFDFNQMTEWEKNVAKKWIPFYTWAKKNFEFQLKIFVNTPQRMNRTQQVIKAMYDAQGVDYEKTPEWATEQMWVPIKDGDSIRYMKFNPPVADFVAVGNLEILSRVSPVYKSVIETLTGKDMFTGKAQSAWGSIKNNLWAPYAKLLAAPFDIPVGQIPMGGGRKLGSIVGQDIDFANKNSVWITENVSKLRKSYYWEQLNKLQDFVTALQNQGYTVPTTAELQLQKLRAQHAVNPSPFTLGAFKKLKL